jgi:hypothetical protein
MHLSRNTSHISLQSALTPETAKRTSTQRSKSFGTPQSSDDPELYLRASSKRLFLDTIGQAAWAEKKWLWVEDVEEGYRSAFVVAENGEDVTIEFNDGQVLYNCVYDKLQTFPVLASAIKC